MSTPAFQIATALDNEPFSLMHGAGDGESTESVLTQTYVPVSVTILELFILVTSNTRTASSTLTLRKNGGSTSLVVSVPSTTTGMFQDLTDSMSVLVGDLIDYGLSAGPFLTTINIAVAAIVFHSSVATEILGPTQDGTLVAYANANNFEHVSGAVNAFTTEAVSQYRIRMNATWNLLSAAIDFNSLTTASTERTRINAANGNQSVSIPGGTTGAFQDLVDSDSVASASLIDYVMVIVPSANFIRLHNLSTGMSGPSFICLFSSAAVPSKTTLFLPIQGGNNSTSNAPFTSEAGVNYKIPEKSVGSDLQFTTNNNTLNGSSTVTLRKNGANGNMAVSVPASTAGIFEDLVDTDTLNVGDLVNYSMVTGGSSGTVFGSTPSMLVSPPAPPPPSVTVAPFIAEVSTRFDEHTTSGHTPRI